MKSSPKVSKRTLPFVASFCVSTLVLYASQSFSNTAGLQLLNKLESKYALSDPNNNQDGDESVIQKIERIKANQPDSSSDLEYVLLKRYAENKTVYKPQVEGSCKPDEIVNERGYCEKAAVELETGRLDFARFNIDPEAFPDKLKTNYDDAVSLTEDVTLPATTGGQIDIPVSEDKVRLYRDADGNLATEVNETPTYINHSVGNHDLVSSEIDHGDTTFESKDAYGDEDALIETGRAALASDKVAPTSLGLAYRTILKADEVNEPAEIHPRDPLLDAGFNEVALAESGTGEWGESCNEEETTVETTTHYPKWETRFCTEPKRDNPQSCQVEMDLDLPIKIEDVEGTLQAGTNISYVNSNTLRLEFSSLDNSHSDARSYNAEYPEASPFREKQCRTYWTRFKVRFKEGISLVRMTRQGGAIDDTAKEFINGQLSHHMIPGSYSHNVYWAGALPETLPFPVSYYNNWPADAKMLYESGQMTSGFPTCENNGGSVGDKDLTAYATTSEGGVIVELMLGIGGLGELNLTYDMEFAENIKPDITYTESPRGCGELIGWYPPSDIPEGVCHPQCEVYTSTGGIGPAGSGCNELCAVQSQIEKGMCKADLWQSAIVGTNGYDSTVLDFVPPMFRGDTGEVTWLGNAQGFMCDPLGGDPLSVDRNGDGVIGSDETFTYEQIRTQPNECKEYQVNSLCNPVDSFCEDGWKDEATGICYMKRKTYSCDVGATITTEKTQLTNTCAGLLPCTTGDCELKDEETNDQFVNAMVNLNIAQHMESDYSCTDNTDPSSCTVFNGEGGFCSWEQTGLGNDCCESPGGASVLEYAMMANDAMNHIQNSNLTAPDFITDASAYAEAGYEKFTETVGENYDTAYETLSDGTTAVYEYLVETPQGESAASAYDYAATSITDISSSIAGNATKEVATETGTKVLEDLASDTASDVAGGAAQEGALAQMQQEMLNSVAEALPEGLRDVLFDAVEDVAADAATEAVAKEAAVEAGTDYVVDSTLSNVAGVVMGAYAAYTYAKIALSLYSSCEELDLETAIKVGQGQCVSVGANYHPDWDWAMTVKRQDYCCYNSMLARIIMEQASPLLGHDLEQYSAEVIDDSTLRSCPGLTAEQLANLDWSQIDLTDWVTVMMGAGIMPQDTSEEALTENRSMNQNSRETTTERTLSRMEQAGENGWADRAVESTEYLTADNVDCSYLPRPIVCDYNEIPDP